MLDANTKGKTPDPPAAAQPAVQPAPDAPDCRNEITGRLDLSKICDITELYETHLKTADEVLESSKNPEIVAKVEHAVILWCKSIEKVLALSKQTRMETDDMGPNGMQHSED